LIGNNERQRMKRRTTTNVRLGALPWVIGALGMAIVIGLFAWGVHHDDQMTASGQNPSLTTPGGATTGYGGSARR
jgi:hypothetical protein